MRLVLFLLFLSPQKYLTIRKRSTPADTIKLPNAKKLGDIESMLRANKLVARPHKVNPANVAPKGNF